MIKFRFILVALLAVPVVSVIAADIPMMINYQGNITDATGSPLNGKGYFKFAIVNAAGNTAYWVNDATTTNGSEPTESVVIPVTNGLFSVKLGNTSLTNMTALNPDIFTQTDVYLRVWFSFDDLNFEPFSPDTQIVSTGFSFKAQQANTVVDNSVASDSIEDNSIRNIDISNTAAISASKIDSVGLDADSLDGRDAVEFASNDHAHSNVDAATLDGFDSLDFAFGNHGHTTIDADTVDGFHASAFALGIHGHTHATLLGTGSSDHHEKTTLFTDMQGVLSTNQIPDAITRDTEAADTYVSKIGDSTIAGSLTVNDITYQSAQTKYLMLAGGQCTGLPSGGSRQSFSCGLANSTGYWSVNVPDGSTLTAMKVSLFTAAGSLTVCNLEAGISPDTTTNIGTVTDSDTPNWHWSNEITFNQLVNTETTAYSVSCSNSSLSNSNVGAIRIRYTVPSP